MESQVRQTLHAGNHYEFSQSQGSSTTINGNIHNHGTMNITAEQRINSNKTDEDLNKELLIAAEYHRLQVMESLLERGADPNYSDSESFTALHYAAWNGKRGAVQLLLSKDAKVDAYSPKWGTALCIAAARGRCEAVHELLKRSARTDIASEYLGFPLYAAAYGGHGEIIRKLLRSGAQMKATAKMHLAVLSGIRIPNALENFAQSVGNIAPSELAVDTAIRAALNAGPMLSIGILLVNHALASVGNNSTRFNDACRRVATSKNSSEAVNTDTYLVDLIELDDILDATTTVPVPTCGDQNEQEAEQAGATKVGLADRCKTSLAKLSEKAGKCVHRQSSSGQHEGFI